VREDVAIKRIESGIVNIGDEHAFAQVVEHNDAYTGVDDSVIQRILRHSTVATTQNQYIKTASSDAITAMKQFSEALLCSTCAPDGDIKVKGSVQ
jgi:integrase